MSIDEILTYIKENAKKWTIEQSTGPIIISKGNVKLTIDTNTVAWSVSDIHNKHAIVTSEETLKVLLSRDWIEQTYCRGFGYIARTNDPDNDIWPEDFVDYVDERRDPFSFVQHIKWRANCRGEYKGGGTIYMDTICSLDKFTLGAMNNEIDAQVSDGVGESCELVKLSSDGYFYKEK